MSQIGDVRFITINPRGLLKRRGQFPAIKRVGLIVREGAARPDITTLDAFKKAMLGAKSVVHSNPAATPSGGHFGKMWESLGIADAMKDKLCFRNALDGGARVRAQG